MQSVVMVDRIESTVDRFESMVDRFESLVTQNSIVTATRAYVLAKSYMRAERGAAWSRTAVQHGLFTFLPTVFASARIVFLDLAGTIRTEFW